MMTTSKTDSRIYTIERVTEYYKPSGFDEFIKQNAPKISELFDGKFNPSNAAINHMIKKGIFLVGKRNGVITGLHISFLINSPLDINVKILQQQLFYVMPDSGRMAYHLFQKFIDIGKSEANHIITMLTRHTNIKPETLGRMGFKELEVLFRLEV